MKTLLKIILPIILFSVNVFAINWPPPDIQFTCTAEATCHCRYTEVYMCREGWQYKIQLQSSILAQSQSLAEERAQNLLMCDWNYYKSEMKEGCHE